MRTQLVTTRAAISVLLAVAALALPANHATVAAGQGDGEDPVWTEGGDVLGRLRTQLGTLESGSTGSGGGTPPSCTWHDRTLDSDDPDYERHDGVLRWRPPGQGSDFWIDDGEAGTVWRYECWHDKMAEGGCWTPAPETEGCLGDYYSDTWCGSFLCTFDAVTPANLARLVVEDDFRDQLSEPQPRFSPPNEETLVNFDTWLWVDNIPESGLDGPWEISVLDVMSVEATATMHEVRWDMGDANDPESEFTCPLTTDEASAREDCKYAYKRSSAGQPNDEFQGNVSVVWEVNWTATIFGQTVPNEEPIEALLENEFSLAVAESQAIITD